MSFGFIPVLVGAGAGMGLTLVGVKDTGAPLGYGLELLVRLAGQPGSESGGTPDQRAGGAR